MYEHMLVYLYNVVFDCIHLSELFTYPNKMFVAFDQWGSDNRGFTVSTFTKKGLSSVFVNTVSVQDDPDLNRKLNEGMYQLVYIGPEMLFGQQIYRDMLMNPVYQKHLVAFVVDEAHCIKSWGTKCREAFMRLGEVRSLIHPSLNVMALTATAVHHTKTVIRRTLGMSQNSCEIVASPIKKTSSLS